MVAKKKQQQEQQQKQQKQQWTQDITNEDDDSREDGSNRFTSATAANGAKAWGDWRIDSRNMNYSPAVARLLTMAGQSVDGLEQQQREIRIGCSSSSSSSSNSSNSSSTASSTGSSLSSGRGAVSNVQ
uniref:Uncharacterized protein n=1 Tax=Anopheles farauti TaxID=69004 RepID=A0A182Q556_9DIPT